MTTYRFPNRSQLRLSRGSLSTEPVYRLPREKRGRSAPAGPEKYPSVREPQVNPDTNEPFRDRRSRVLSCGRVLCYGVDASLLRERVAKRESEICQRCGGWAQADPPEGFWPGNNHHKAGKGAGKRNDRDRRENTEWLCGGPKGCHQAHHDGPKPCPPKSVELQSVAG